MITVSNSSTSPCTGENLQSSFLALLPGITHHAHMQFRDIKCPDKKADLVAETLGLAWKWLCRLSEQGKDVFQFPAVFASLAARAVRSGRRVCGQEKAKDALSATAQRRNGFKVESLLSSMHMPVDAKPRGQQRLDDMEERLHDNTVTPVPDQAAFRLDFPVWLKTLSARDRRIIRWMLKGERTTDLSRRFKISAARISQLRREFQRGWQRFVGELDEQLAAA
jgi:hypothetical protein